MAGTNFIDARIVEAVAESGRTEASAAPGSPERWRGLIVMAITSQYRQMQQRLSEVDPGWRPEKNA